MSDKKIYNSFDFICKLVIPKETEKFKPYKKDKYDSGWIKEQLLVFAKTDVSSVMLTFEDGYYDKKDYKIKTFSKSETKANGDVVKGSQLEIPWNDRQKKAVVDKVADFKKVTFDTSSYHERIVLERFISNIKEGKGSDEEKKKIEAMYGTQEVSALEEKLKELNACKKEFISNVDLIALLKADLSKYDGELFHVKGNIEYSEWNGKGRQKFIPKTIERAGNEKPRLHGLVDIFYNSVSLYDDIFEETRKYIINGYTRNYDGQLKKEIFVPMQFVIDGSKIEKDNEIGNKKLEGLVKPFRVEDDIIHELQYKVKFMNGADRKEITMDDLTEFQREQVILGNQDFDELKKQLGGNKFGDNVNENRLFGINLVDFPNGAVDTSFTDEDLAIVRPQQEDKSENSNTSSEDEPAIQTDDSDLF